MSFHGRVGGRNVALSSGIIPPIGEITKFLLIRLSPAAAGEGLPLEIARAFIAARLATWVDVDEVLSAGRALLLALVIAGVCRSNFIQSVEPGLR